MKNLVRELRTHTGMTQEDLGRKLGVSRQTIISIEGGRYDPSLTLALMLARELGSTVEKLFLLPETTLEEEK